MTTEITVTDLKAASVYDEPRISDIRIAERLGYDRPRKVREIIERRMDEFESYGSLPYDQASTHDGTRPTAGRVYHLNEAQAILVCMFSRTPAAAAVRKEVIGVYMGWRRGDLRLPSAAVYEALENRFTKEVYDHLMPVMTHEWVRLSPQQIATITRKSYRWAVDYIDRLVEYGHLEVRPIPGSTARQYRMPVGYRPMLGRV